VSPSFKKSPKIGGYRGLIENIAAAPIKRDRRKRGAGYFLPGDWGCPPAFKKSPNLGGYRGLIKSISAASI
jgi:hypothetical protein